MQLAVDVAGFTPGEADQLRQAMGSKRSQARMAAHARPAAWRAWPSAASPATRPRRSARRSKAFADFGFPESHSVSFAYLVYSSSWIKYHYPAEFAAALLNAQPMGFYSPHTIVRDATPSRCAGARSRSSTRRGATRRSNRAPSDVGPDRPSRAGLARRAVASSRCGSGCGPCAGSARRVARPHRRRTRRAAVHRSRRLRAAHRRDRRPVEALATAGAFERASASRPARPRCGPRARCATRACPTADAARGGHRGRGAAAAGHDRDGGDRAPTSGRWGCRRRGTPPSSCATSWRAQGVVTAARAARAARPHGRRGRRRGDAPPATGDREGHGVPQPRGRDRPRQRDLHARRVEAVPDRRPHRTRARVRGLLEKHQGVINVLARRIVASRSVSPTCSSHATSTSSTAKGVHRAEFGQREPSSGRHQVRRSSP